MNTSAAFFFNLSCRFSETDITFAVIFRCEEEFLAFLDHFESISRGSEIKNYYFRLFFMGQIIFFSIITHTYLMGNKPPPLQKQANYEKSTKSICAEARFSFLVLEPQITI